MLTIIENLYEDHRKEIDPIKKKEIYGQIDEFSKKASKYVILKEFDKMMSKIGTAHVNTFTSFDNTIYENIPSFSPFFSL